jgi:predicted transposase YbfD/YdcC
LEIRETYLYARQNNLAEGWESIKTIAFVCRYVLSKKKEHKSESFYVTDIQTENAAYIAKGIRSHWHIENKLHHVKDVVMLEDTKSTKNKQAAANLALLRNFAFNILKTKNSSIKYATEILQNYTVSELCEILYRT